MTTSDTSIRLNGHSTTVGAVKKSNGTVAAKVKQNDSLQIWKTLVQCLPPRTGDCDFWWMLTGRHLAVMLEEAGASVGQQYIALTFHYNWVVPLMGPKPGVDGVIPGRWKSLIQADGTPMEYSWKWNTAQDSPTVRYAVEPIGEHAGTELDPLNQQATRKVLHQLSQAFPETNLEWTNHLYSTLFEHDNTKLVREGASGVKLSTNTGIGVDFGANGMAFKAYFHGQKLNQPGHSRGSGRTLGFLELKPARSTPEALQSGRRLRVARKVAVEAIYEHPAHELRLREGRRNSGRSLLGRSGREAAARRP
ncbi:hypothetical protein O1611_g10255 [Lasiodiplodia mahajangana]|uniref:Uncharacterized protein n=1 Tax=Lasiodiplodia mahajangana TaxID=1108764 RepID=A0ACC2J0D5_9PEZI|nr:hypothetical protein O1611_g10255 [Lasiodiplodia mahajangana]